MDGNVNTPIFAESTMTATITTDASFYNNYSVGAYAFWITTAKGRIIKAGPLKGEITSPHEAEFKTIINGLHRLHSLKFEKISKIYINTDSKFVIDAITKTNKSKESWFYDVLNQYKELIGLLGAEVEIRHVKAHKHTRTKRNWVNQWCNDNAKHQAKIEIKKRFGIELK